MRMTPSAERDAEGIDGAAGVAERLAVLLTAGVAPASAWTYLAEDGPGSGSLLPVAQAAASGDSVPRAILDGLGAGATAEGSAWRGIAAAWQVASDAGAPLAPALTRLSGSLRTLADLDRRSSVALAAPVATARLVSALPVAGILFGIVLGFDPLGVLVGTLPGVACLVAGSILVLCARQWNRRLVAAARPASRTPGLVLDLMAIAVSGGAPMRRAGELVAGACRQCGIDEGVDGPGRDGPGRNGPGRDEKGRRVAGERDRGEHGRVARILRLSARAGVPAATLLRSAAEESRRIAAVEGERRVAALGVRLMLPLGLCILPAFMLVGVLPLIVSVISSTSLSI